MESGVNLASQLWGRGYPYHRTAFSNKKIKRWSDWMNTEVNAAKTMMSDSKFYMGYSRWDDQLNRYENWNESVARVMNMHRQKYAEVMTPELAQLIDFAEQAYCEKLVLGSQRALQFGGSQIFKHEARLYNCSFSYTDRARFFQEAMYLLLCGCGVGFSVQKHHIAKLSQIKAPNKHSAQVFEVEDSIEGWSDAFGVLLASYFVDGGTFPEFAGKNVYFDFTKIRPKGSYISGGFKAPGPDGLARSLDKCRQLLNSIVAQANGETVALRPIHAYDFVMHMADAVLSGGIRRAATICIFSKDDEEMLAAKTGNWRTVNPQRGRSNNSALIVRDELTREEWVKIFGSVKQFGEPGFIFAEDTEMGFNPCVEIGLRAYTEDGRSGFHFCNLTETNGGACYDRETFLRACRAAAILGSLQAGYTNFTYLDPASKEITDREALLGCSVTGWMSNPDTLFNEDNMRDGAHLIREVNQRMAELLGTRPAARCTTVKPSGNASVLLGCASGIHGEHSKRYLRNVQMNKQDAVTELLMTTNPKMCEDSVWSPNKTDVVVSFPLVTNPGSIFKSDLYGVKLLEKIKLCQSVWIEEGTNVDLCVDPRLRHNVSNTVSVDDWDAVEEYIFQNRKYYAGISLLSTYGDRDYPQAPFTEVFTSEELVEMYGVAAMFASGLIVDGMHAFNDNLWNACDTAMGHGEELTEESKDLTKRDWVRRFGKFAQNYFAGDQTKASYCLKDVYNLHKWEGIERSLKFVDFSMDLNQQKYTEVDTMAAAGCAGGACEIDFA
jgi:ribonucleoside-triphosphate reductase (thioredoxin)